MTMLTPPEHQHSEAVTRAAMWLSEQDPAPQPTIPAVRARFNLGALGACEAAALSNKFRVFRKAHG